jgi:WD40 repeat protein
MTEAGNKKRSAIIFFLAALFAIVVVMFIANRESVLAEKVRFPFNNGVAKLSTYKNFLVAVCLDNKVYVWDWNNLSEEPRTGLAQSHQAALIGYDTVVSLRQRTPTALVVTNLEGDRKHKEVLTSTNEGRAYLAVSGDARSVALCITKEQEGDGEKANCQLLTFDPDASKVDPVIKISGEDAVPSQVRGLAISDDGGFVVLVSEREDDCWVDLIDTKTKRKVWEEMLPSAQGFAHMAFSPDAEMIYVGYGAGALYKIQTASGELLNRLVVAKDNGSMSSGGSCWDVAVSQDGSLVAAIVSEVAHVWDCKTDEKIFTKRPDHKITGNLAFSPDRRFLATSDMRQGGTINIWRMPR